MFDNQGAGARGLYTEVQCIMGKGHMRTPFPMDTDMTGNITFSQLHGLAEGNKNRCRFGHG